MSSAAFSFLPALLLLWTTPGVVQSLSPPNCSLRESVCNGYEILGRVQGSTMEEKLQNLYDDFCGCVYVKGNIGINFDNNAEALTEQNFSMFYYLREIYGSLIIRDVNANGSRIIFPNLRIIRGDELLVLGSRKVSLRLDNVVTSAFILPQLTEITRGGVYVTNLNCLQSFRRVNWNDILEPGGGGVYEDINNNNNLRCSIDDLPACSGCDPLFCWGDDFCQNRTRLICEDPATPYRCFTDADGNIRTCDVECSAGCTGPSSRECNACRNVLNNGSCVAECPDRQIYSSAVFGLVPNPDFKLTEGRFCVDNCSAGLLQADKHCVTSCPDNMFASRDHLSCIPCDGPCPVSQECPGIEDGSELNTGNVMNFENCTIVTGNLIINFQSRSLSYSDFEVLSTVTEIRGHLVILELANTSFPHLRNLRIIGSNNTQLYQGCCVFTLRNNAELVNIDLSALEVIASNGLTFLTENPELCYLGDLNSITTRNNGTTFWPRYRRNSTMCVSEGLTCHSQCDSLTSCWGPTDSQCEGCRYFTFERRCVQNCSVEVTGVAPTDPGFYQNNESRVCEPCHAQCVGGCPGGTGPEHCQSCRTYFLRSGQQGSTMECVVTCPLGTYLNSTLSECLPCHAHCDNRGCSGPLPFVNLTSGCHGCSLVQLFSDGSQDMCVDGSCSGSYYSSMYISANFNPAVAGDLHIDTRTCLPCHRLCATCTGPRLESGECETCKYAKKNGTCAESCNNETEYQDSNNEVCQRCSSVCHGCTGALTTQCVACANSLLKRFTSVVSDEFLCVSDCGDSFYVTEGRCSPCDTSCLSCNGPGPGNCTMCAPSFIPGNVVGDVLSCTQPTPSSSASVAVTTDSSSNIASNQNVIIIIILPSTVMVSAIIISVLIIIIIRKKIAQKMSKNNYAPNATYEDPLYESVGPKLPKRRASFFYRHKKTGDNICSTESNLLSHIKLESNDCYNCTIIENSTNTLLPTKDSNDVAAQQNESSLACIKLESNECYNCTIVENSTDTLLPTKDSNDVAAQQNESSLARIKLESNECYDCTIVENSTDSHYLTLLPTKNSNGMAAQQNESSHAHIELESNECYNCTIVENSTGTLLPAKDSNGVAAQQNESSHVHIELESNECYNCTTVENSTDTLLPAKDSNDVATQQCGSLNGDQENYRITENAAYASNPKCELTISEKYDYI